MPFPALISANLDRNFRTGDAHYASEIRCLTISITGRDFLCEVEYRYGRIKFAASKESSASG
jgi:hypothetical protein